MDPKNGSANISSAPSQNYAGFGLRFLAYWVDFLILFPMGLAVQSMFGNNPFAIFSVQSLAELQKFQASPNFIVTLLVSIGFYLIYLLVFWVNYDGATPGKKLLGIKITRDNGEKMTYPSAMVRYFGFLVSSATMIIFGLGFLWIIWDQKKQALHDKIAGTIVIKTGQPSRIILGLILAGLAILLFVGYFAAVFAKGFQLGMAEARKNVPNRTMTNAEQLTQAQADGLAEDTFAKLNDTRSQSGLAALKVDSQLCAYAARRLDQVTTLGKPDDGRGFYEDLASSQITTAYFSQFTKAGTILFTYPNSLTTASDVVSSWTKVDDSTATNKDYDYGCVRANPVFVVLIAASHK